ncbi:Ig-like domain repeat protein [Nocardioides sp.]|uniref:Ig-like domain repeat protein n=1 Tax=Nocardioides sp. TaxID=35761 RepID=UPI0031FE91E1|nr:hypothetical protein [Nocardioides sp.]
MTNFRRALSTIAVSAVITSGLVAGSAVTADAQPAHRSPTAGQRGLLQLIPLQLPLLSGLGDTGSLLNVTQPVWNLLGVTNNIVWLRDGIPIAGTTGVWNYLPTNLDVGHEVSAKVTGSLLGLLPLSLITNALGITLLGSTAPAATSPPVVSGDAKVGTLLTATAPVWDTTVDSTDYQWLLSGVAIDGATTSNYTVVAGDVAKNLSVRTTGIKGDTQGVATSAAVLAKIGDAITVIAAPSIAGTGKVGALLSAGPGTWTGQPAPVFGYQWMRGGAVIAGATDSTYVVKAADAGRTLTLKVVATRAGYLPGSATTSGLPVARMSSATRASLIKKTVARGARGLLKLTLRATGAKPSGSVKVFDGAKLLKGYVVRASDNGTRTVRLSRLKPGVHRIKAVFAGSAAFTGSRSQVVRLRVTK